MNSPIFKTPHLHLCPCNQGDIAALEKSLGHKLSKLLFCLEDALEQEFFVWQILSQCGDELLGIIALVGAGGTKELKWHLNRVKNEEEIFKEAACAIKEYAFQALGAQRVLCTVATKEEAYKRALNSIGMILLKTEGEGEKRFDTFEASRLVLCPFDAKWEASYKQEAMRLEQIFANHPITFHHIGSTSIDGCFAKPIIDILGITNDITTIDAFNGSLTKCGYTPLGEFGVRQRRLFRKRDNGEVNLHIFEDSDPEAYRHLRFRDYLRAHPQEVEKYSNLKQELAQKHPSDIVRYILGKERFVKNIDYMAVLQDTGSYWNLRSYPRKSKWTKEEIQKGMEANMHLQMTYFAKYLPDLQIVYQSDVVVVRSSMADDTFNYVIQAHFSEKEAENRVEEVIALFKEKELPFSWWVGDNDTPSSLKQALQKQGLHLKEKDVGMYLPLDNCPLEMAASPVSIQRVLDTKAIKDFASVMVSIGGLNNIYDLFFGKIPPTLYAKGAPFEIYVGYLDEVPVVTGILVLHANVGGIYYIMTHPNYRRRGFGTNMMLFLLKRAQEQGYHLATLQASEEGVRLYQRLGFEPLCQFVEYA